MLARAKSLLPSQVRSSIAAQNSGGGSDSDDDGKKGDTRSKIIDGRKIAAVIRVEVLSLNQSRLPFSYLVPVIVESHHPPFLSSGVACGGNAGQ